MLESFDHEQYVEIMSLLKVDDPRVLGAIDEYSGEETSRIRAYWIALVSLTFAMMAFCVVSWILGTAVWNSVTSFHHVQELTDALVPNSEGGGGFEMDWSFLGNLPFLFLLGAVAMLISSRIVGRISRRYRSSKGFAIARTLDCLYGIQCGLEGRQNDSEFIVLALRDVERWLAEEGWRTVGGARAPTPWHRRQVRARFRSAARFVGEMVEPVLMYRASIYQVTSSNLKKILDCLVTGAWDDLPEAPRESKTLGQMMDPVILGGLIPIGCVVTADHFKLNYSMEAPLRTFCLIWLIVALATSIIGRQRFQILLRDVKSVIAVLKSLISKTQEKGSAHANAENPAEAEG